MCMATGASKYANVKSDSHQPPLPVGAICQRDLMSKNPCFPTQGELVQFTFDAFGLMSRNSDSNKCDEKSDLLHAIYSSIMTSKLTSFVIAAWAIVNPIMLLGVIGTIAVSLPGHNDSLSKSFAVFSRSVCLLFWISSFSNFQCCS